MDNETLHDAFDLAKQRGTDWIDAMTEMLAPDGLSYWDAKFQSEADFVAWWLDMGTYPSPEFPVLHFLEQVSPTVYREGQQRYERARMKAIAGSR